MNLKIVWKQELIFGHIFAENVSHEPYAMIIFNNKKVEFQIHEWRMKLLNN